jgi:hypothetical protein
LIGRSIFAKASRSAEIRGVIPDGPGDITAAYAVRGLDSSELFWSIGFIDCDSDKTPNLVFGFVGDDDVERSEKVSSLRELIEGDERLK